MHHRLVSAYENKVLVKTDYIYAWFTANYGEPSFSKFVTAVLHSATRCRIRSTAKCIVLSVLDIVIRHSHV